MLSFCSRSGEGNFWDAAALVHFRELVLASPNINCIDPVSGCTPLMLLCWKNHSDSLLSCVETLFLRHNDLDVNFKRENGFNALHYLCRYNRSVQLLDVARFLISHNIDATANNKEGMNALHLLCTFHKTDRLIDAIRLLVDAGRVDIHATDNWGMNALHFLCRYETGDQFLNAVKLLLEKGIDVNAQNSKGLTAERMLRWWRNIPNKSDIIHLLLENEALIEEKEKCNIM